MHNKEIYSNEFKLEVVRNYLSSPYGVRVVASSYGLGSKNYIHRWMKELITKGLLNPSECAVKSKTIAGIPTLKLSPYQSFGKTAREVQLETEVIRLKAEVAFLKKLKELERRDARGKRNI